MGTISVSLPTDGSTADVADYNTPINTIVAEINGNLDNDNIDASAAIATSKLADDAGIGTAKLEAASVTNAKLATSSGEIGAAWLAWTPTLTNVTIGNGTVTAKFIKVGKTVNFRIHIVAGNTTSVTGAVSFTLPLTGLAPAATTYLTPIGSCHLDNVGVDSYIGLLAQSSTTVVSPLIMVASGTYGGWTNWNATVPFNSFATSDYFEATGCYEIA